MKADDNLMSSAHSFLGAVLALTGNGAEAFRWIEKVIESDRPPSSPWA